MKQKVLVGESRFFRALYRSFFLFAFDRKEDMTTALQRLHWHFSRRGPCSDLTRSDDMSIPMFCVLVGMLAVCVVAAGLILIGAI